MLDMLDIPAGVCVLFVDLLFDDIDIDGMVDECEPPKELFDLILKRLVGLFEPVDELFELDFLAGYAAQVFLKVNKELFRKRTLLFALRNLYVCLLYTSPSPRDS